MRKKTLSERLRDKIFSNPPKSLLNVYVRDLINLTTKQDQMISDLLRRIEVLEYERKAIIEKLDKYHKDHSGILYACQDSNMLCAEVHNRISKVVEYIPETLAQYDSRIRNNANNIENVHLNVEKLENCYSEGMHSVSKMIDHLSVGIDRLWDYVEKKNGKL